MPGIRNADEDGFWRMILALALFALIVWARG